MMQNPIPSVFWVRLFQGAALTTTAATLLSLYREKKAAGWSLISEHICTLRGKELNYDDAAAALEAILEALDSEARSKKAAVKLQLRSRSIASLLAKLLTFHVEDGDDSAKLCALVCRIVVKAFAKDPSGRDDWNAVHGHHKLLALVSTAHKEGNAKLMDDAAQALHEVSEVDESDMSLPIDIPPGSQGALSLCRFSGTVKMLRTLDKDARIAYLINTTAIFASLCTLRPGGLVISKGVDNKSGASYFLDLLDSRANQRLVENCARSLNWISVHDKASHKEFTNPTNVVKIVDILEPVQTTNAIHSALSLIANLSHHQHAAEFLAQFMQVNGPTALIRLWCKGAEKETRDRAEAVVRLLGCMPQCTDEIVRLMELHRSMLMERRAKDEEDQKKAMLQMQQQRMYQQQMMMQMAQSGQLPGMDDDE